MGASPEGSPEGASPEGSPEGPPVGPLVGASPEGPPVACRRRRISRNPRLPRTTASTAIPPRTSGIGGPEDPVEPLDCESGCPLEAAVAPGSADPAGSPAVDDATAISVSVAPGAEEIVELPDAAEDGVSVAPGARVGAGVGTGVAAGVGDGDGDGVGVGAGEST